MKEAIERLEKEIKSLERCLPYADGQAYYSDKRRIAELKDLLKKLN